jgi:S-adenosylmethionine hydrolase
MAIITLITDFGTQDEYVGVLKGVILGTDAGAEIVDICHNIGIQDITAAAHALKSAYAYFPEGTVHAAIVDPGVGTDRSIIAAQAGDHRFIAPDNGLLEPVLAAGDSPVIHRVENEKLFRHPVSPTFHGRDIIAPVAAHLSAGLALKDVGPVMALADIHPLDVRDARWISPDVIEGRIISIDRFGNLMTNIHTRELKNLGETELLIMAGDATISGLRTTYAQGTSGEPIAVISSRNTIEIAVNEGNAAHTLNLAKGAVVHVNTVRG